MASTSRYSVSEAISPADIQAAQALRAKCFGRAGPLDRDAYDARARHFILRETTTGQVLCCYRLMALRACDLPASYAAQFYELSRLESYGGLMMELGRFCVDPDCADPDILRAAWAALTEFVDENGIEMLFGCSSFAGTETDEYLDAFAMLKARHLGPKRWLPRVKAPNVFRYGAKLRRKPDLKKAMRAMPPLLRSYLMMGGWVSDHAVVDAQMNTLHVFTGLEIGAIPARRKRALRALRALN